MYPSFNKVIKSEDVIDEAAQGVASLCPLGCLCCIMQQFYKRRCWCNEVKESTGTQTDPVDPDVLFGVRKMTTVSTQTDAKENLPPLVNGTTDKEETTEFDSQSAVSKQNGSPDNNRGPVLSPGRWGAGPRERGWLIKREGHKGKDIVSLTQMSTVKVKIEDAASPTMRPESNGNAYTLTNTDNKAGPQSTTEVVYVQPPWPIGSRYRKHKDKDPEPALQTYCTHGTMEHTALQTAVNAIMDKYDLSGAKDPVFEQAFDELMAQFPALKDDEDGTLMVRSKLRHRISSKRHYSRIKTEATAIGVAVSALKRRRIEENAIQHQILGETIVRNSLSISPPPKISCATKARLDLKLRSRNCLTSMSPPSQCHTNQTASPPNLHPIASSGLRFDHPTALLLSPTAAHVTTSRDTSDRKSQLACLLDARVHGSNPSDAGVKQEHIDKGDNADIEEEALDLSDPRHDVIIKIEPFDTVEFT